MNAVKEHISLVLSSLAVIISFWAVIETMIGRKQKIIHERVKVLQEACNIINDIPLTENKGVIHFNQIINLRKIVYGYLWFLNEKDFADIKDRFQVININYEKVAGIAINSFDMDLTLTCSLYGEMKYPVELEMFYNEIKAILETELRKTEVLLYKKGKQCSNSRNKK